MDDSINASQSVVPGPATSLLPGNLLEMQILSPHPDLLNQKLGECGPAVYVFTSPLGNSDACLS